VEENIFLPSIHFLESYKHVFYSYIINYIQLGEGIQLETGNPRDRGEDIIRGRSEC
jgi:hypothetical protein